MFTFCFFCVRLKKTKENPMNVVFIAGVAEKIREWFTSWVGGLLSIIPKTLYFLCTLIFQILDILQLLVRKVAGLDVVYYSSSSLLGDSEATMESGDLVLRFIRTIFTGDNAILSNIFWALIILALILLIITTFVAVLRSEYAATDAKSASKGKIIGRALKAIASFAIVPIVCFFGIYLSNVILQALDTITSGTSSSELAGASYTVTEADGSTTTYNISNLFKQYTTSTDQKTYVSYNFLGNNDKVSVATSSTPISGLIFKASAYKSNRIRNYTIFQNHLSDANVNAGVFNNFGEQYSRAANLLDECYANSYTLKTAAPLGSNDDFNKSFLYPFGDRGSFLGNYAPDSIQIFDKNDVKQVWFYYDLWSFDFVICIGALVIAAKLLIYLTFGLMKRIFELVVLFLIAAPISSLMPLDDGAALKKWREKFTSKVISAYGPVVGLNLFFVILPFITEIKFFNIPFVDSIVTMLFVIVGLIMVKDLCGTISELIGGDDAMKGGEGMAGEVGGTISKIGQVAAMPAGLAVKGSKLAFKGIKGATNKISGMRDKHRQKEAENEAALEGLDADTRDTILTGSAGYRRRALRSLRAGMTDKQRGAAREAYEEKAAQEKADKRLARYNGKEGSKGSWRKRRDDAEQEKASLRLGAMRANNMDADAWNHLSTEQQDNLIAQQRVKRASSQSAAPLQHQVNGLNARIKRMSLNKEKNLNDAAESRKSGDALVAQADRDDAQIKQWEAQLLQKKSDRLNNYGGDEEGRDEIRLKRRIAEAKEISGRRREESKKAYAFADASEAKAAEFGEQEEKLIQQRNSVQANLDKSNEQAALNESQQNTAKNVQNLVASGGYLKNSGISAADAAKAGKKMANAFKDALSSDNLSPIFNALGANLAKGFTDAGGFKAIEARMHGYSGKEEKMAEELKTQKRILSAQDNASKLLGRGGGGPSKVELDDKTIQKLADAITKAAPKK